MRGEIYKFNLKKNEAGVFVTGTGDPRNVVDLEQMWIQVSGTFTATLQIEGTIDGTTWFNIGAAFTNTGGTLEVSPKSLAALRVNTTAFTSGTPVVYLAAKNVRADS